MRDVTAAFPNTSNWYHNASFILPLISALAVSVLAAVKHSSELAGFAGFLVVVTLAMLPLVLAGWRRTATAVVVTRWELVSLHDGRLLKSIGWAGVRHIQERETQGNIRWEVSTETGEALLLDGELEDLPRLVQLARELAGV